MVYRMKMEAFFQNRFQRFQKVVLAFPYFTAIEANQVMMKVTVFFAIVQFITAAAVVKIELLQEIHLREQVKRSVYGSQTDIGSGDFDELEYVFGA